MSENIRLKDIAEILNVSITTVSKALSNSPEISDKVKQLVVAKAKELNYVPNDLGFSLKKNETHIIGVIIPETVHHFFSTVLSGIIQEAEKHNYYVIILQSNEKIEVEKKQLELLIQKRVDGILISLSNETNDISHIKYSIDNHTPIVLFDKISKLAKCSKVMIDDFKSSYEATKFLIDKGYKNIAYFRGSYIPQNSIDRYLGYRKALTDHGLEYRDQYVFLCDNNDDFNDGYKNMKVLHESGLLVDAVFTITDLVAIGIIKFLNENQIKIPEQIAVLGFSDWFMSSIISPKLTTIHQPGYEMGQKATQILIAEINAKKEHRQIEYQKKIIETYLVEREST